MDDSGISPMNAQPDDSAPKVSVLMLAFNHRPYLRQAIESVLSQQTTFPFEIVIGEDYSTDGTREIVQEFTDRDPAQVRALLRAGNVGIRQNFRETLIACRGRYVAILEGDDFWTDDRKLQRQVDALEAHPEWAICFHRVQVQHADGSPAEWEPAEDDFPPVTELRDLLRRNFICTPSVMFRNRQFDQWPPAFDNLVQQDWPLHIVNAQHGQIGYLPQPMAAYRRHAGGVWSSQSTARRVEWWFEALDAAEDYLGPDYAGDVRAGRRRLAQQISEQLDKVVSSRDVHWGRAMLKPIRWLRRLMRQN